MRAITSRLAVLFLCSSAALCQELPIVHYGAKDGLPSSFIVSLAQAPDGRIWMGHSAGLSAYDGSAFASWSSANGLLQNEPDSITVDPAGITWAIFSGKGIQYLDPQGRWRTVPDPGGLLTAERAPNLFLTRNGDVLASGRKGYYRVRRSGLEGPFYPVKGKNERVSFVLDSGQQGMLISSVDGVFRKQGESYQPVRLPVEISRLDLVTVMAEGAEGDVWMASRQGSVIRLGKMEAQSWRLPLAEGETPYPTRIQVGDQGIVWIATSIGLFRFKSGQFERYSEKHGLSSASVQDVLIDQGGVVWAATEGGLDKLSQPAFRNFVYYHGFPVNSLWSIEELADGRVWMAGTAGIIEVTPEWNTRVITRKDGLIEENLVHLNPRPDGRVWILGYSTLALWDGKRFRSFPQKEFSTLGVSEVLEVGADEVWITTTEGLKVLTPSSNILRPHSMSEKLGDSVLRMAPDADGNIWVLGDKAQVFRKGGGLEELRLPESLAFTAARRIVTDGAKIWLLTDSGLCHFDGARWRRLTPRDRTFYDFVRRPNGDIWLASGQGIAMYDGERLREYGSFDGVAVGECNTGATLLDSQGTIWLGGKNVTLVRPADFSRFRDADPRIARVVIDNVQYLAPKRLTFSARARSLQFLYSAPAFQNEQEQQYRFYLEGADSDWSTPSTATSARYTQLDPGDYRFGVQVRQKNGDWDRPPVWLAVTAVPAWWQTLWAKIALVISLMLMGVVAGYARIRRLQAQQARLQKIVAEQTAEIKAQRDQMARLAVTDALTGLPNRRRATETLQSELAQSSRSENPLSVLLFDVDRFKQINDQGGHDQGDTVLRGIAAAGLKVARQSDLLARWGGDEFMVIMPDTPTKGAMELSERLRAAFKSEVGVEISGGVATFNGEHYADELIAEADTALYAAKQAGRNQIWAAERGPAAE